MYQTHPPGDLLPKEVEEDAMKGNKMEGESKFLRGDYLRTTPKSSFREFGLREGVGRGKGRGEEGNIFAFIYEWGRREAERDLMRPRREGQQKEETKSNGGINRERAAKIRDQTYSYHKIRSFMGKGEKVPGGRRKGWIGEGKELGRGLPLMRHLPQL